MRVAYLGVREEFFRLKRDYRIDGPVRLLFPEALLGQPFVDDHGQHRQVGEEGQEDGQVDAADEGDGAAEGLA